MWTTAGAAVQGDIDVLISSTAEHTMIARTQENFQDLIFFLDEKLI